MKYQYLFIFFSLLLFSSISHAQTTVTATLTWELKSDGQPATKVQVERSSDNGTTWTSACSAVPPVNQCSDTPQPVGKTYRYRAIPSNSFGNGPTSEVQILAALPPSGFAKFSLLNFIVGGVGTLSEQEELRILDNNQPILSLPHE